MEPEIIKSVRIRPINCKNKHLDNKLDLKLLNNKYVAVFNDTQHLFEFNYNNINKNKIEYFNKNYNSKTCDDIITGFNKNNKIKEDVLINEAILLFQKIKKLKYQIIQDPYKDNSPVYRSFGLEPYYLNNGSKINIIWYKIHIDENTGGYTELIEGGSDWSDEKGNELNYNKKDINKKVIIQTPDNKLWTIGDNSNIVIKGYKQPKIYNGNIHDNVIISDIIKFWIENVAFYKKMCAKQSPNDHCLDVVGSELINIKYIPPSNENVSKKENSATIKRKHQSYTENKSHKKRLSINIENKNIKPRRFIGDFKIRIV